VTPTRIIENFNEIKLAPADIAEISEKFSTSPRRYNIPYIANTPRWDIDIFGDEQEKDARLKVVI
jgi:L-glyceraldehyde reductase